MALLFKITECGRSEKGTRKYDTTQTELDCQLTRFEWGTDTHSVSFSLPHSVNVSCRYYIFFL